MIGNRVEHLPPIAANHGVTRAGRRLQRGEDGTAVLRAAGGG